eukprot:159983-Prymnesium_polylepis.1
MLSCQGNTTEFQRESIAEQVFGELEEAEFEVPKAKLMVLRLRAAGPYVVTIPGDEAMEYMAELGNLLLIHNQGGENTFKIIKCDRDGHPLTTRPSHTPESPAEDDETYLQRIRVERARSRIEDKKVTILMTGVLPTRSMGRVLKDGELAIETKAIHVHLEPLLMRVKAKMSVQQQQNALKDPEAKLNIFIKLPPGEKVTAFKTVEWHRAKFIPIFDGIMPMQMSMNDKWAHALGIRPCCFRPIGERPQCPENCMAYRDEARKFDTRKQKQRNRIDVGEILRGEKERETAAKRAAQEAADNATKRSKRESEDDKMCQDFKLGKVHAALAHAATTHDEMNDHRPTVYLHFQWRHKVPAWTAQASTLVAKPTQQHRMHLRYGGDVRFRCHYMPLLEACRRLGWRVATTVELSGRQRIHMERGRAARMRVWTDERKQRRTGPSTHKFPTVHDMRSDSKRQPRMYRRPRASANGRRESGIHAAGRRMQTLHDTNRSSYQIPQTTVRRHRKNPKGRSHPNRCFLIGARHGRIRVVTGSTRFFPARRREPTPAMHNSTSRAFMNLFLVQRMRWSCVTTQLAYG